MAADAYRESASHPEFICIGPQKTGTAWLYDQAKEHPRVWMPPIKELRYFFEFGNLAERAKAQLQRKLARRKRGPNWDDRDIQFLQLASKSTGEGLEEYVQLFQPAGDCVTGDITPDYCRLDENLISQLATHLPNCRFLFFVRDPIGRLWSQVNMRVRYEKASPLVLTDLPAFKQIAAQPVIRSQSFQSKIIQTWRAIVGPERFRVFLMDDLVADPVAYRRAVFAHIGLNGDECKIEAGFNKKGKEPKVPMPEGFRNFLTEYFGDEYENLSKATQGCRLSAESGAASVSVQA